MGQLAHCKAEYRSGSMPLKKWPMISAGLVILEHF
jgi:hypothetical protein